MNQAGLIEARMLELLAARSPDASICPSDVARALASDNEGWRALMEPVRDVARALAEKNVVVITQGQQVVAPAAPAKGPIRLRRGPAFNASEIR